MNVIDSRQYHSQENVTSARSINTQSEASAGQRNLRPVMAILAIGFVAACAGYMYYHVEDFRFLLGVSGTDLLTATVFILVGFVSSCYQLDLFLRRFELRLGTLELVAVTHAMMLGNLVIPMRGGSGGLAVYLKKIHGLDFTSFAVIYGGTAILVAMINSLMAVIALLALWMISGYFNLVISVAVSVVLLSCLGLTFGAPGPAYRSNIIVNKIIEIANSWKAITADMALLTALTLSITLMSLSLVGSFYYIYRAMGCPLTMEAAIVTSSVGSIVNLIPLTPGSLGVFDVAIIEIQRIFGLTTAQSIAAAMIFRSLTFGLALLVGIPGILYMYMRTSHAEKRPG